MNGGEAGIGAPHISSIHMSFEARGYCREKRFEVVAKIGFADLLVGKSFGKADDLERQDAVLEAARQHGHQVADGGGKIT